MSENSQEQSPQSDDINAMIRDASRTVEHLDRLYPTSPQSEVVDHILTNPELYTAEEALAVLDRLKRTLDERDAARPAIRTLVEAEGIVNDADQRLRDLYPDIEGSEGGR